MTYDNSEEVIEMANRHGFSTRRISMMNTHHATMQEIIIGHNLAWACPEPPGSRHRAGGPDGGWPRSRCPFQTTMRVPPVPRTWGPGRLRTSIGGKKPTV
jgi:hypothetical protein